MYIEESSKEEKKWSTTKKIVVSTVTVCTSLIVIAAILIPVYLLVIKTKPTDNQHPRPSSHTQTSLTDKHTTTIPTEVMQYKQWGILYVNDHVENIKLIM